MVQGFPYDQGAPVPPYDLNMYTFYLKIQFQLNPNTNTDQVNSIFSIAMLVVQSVDRIAADNYKVVNFLSHGGADDNMRDGVYILYQSFTADQLHGSHRLLALLQHHNGKH